MTKIVTKLVEQPKMKHHIAQCPRCKCLLYRVVPKVVKAGAGTCSQCGASFTWEEVEEEQTKSGS